MKSMKASVYNCKLIFLSFALISHKITITIAKNFFLQECPRTENPKMQIYKWNIVNIIMNLGMQKKYDESKPFSRLFYCKAQIYLLQWFGDILFFLVASSTHRPIPILLNYRSLQRPFLECLLKQLSQWQGNPVRNGISVLELSVKKCWFVYTVLVPADLVDKHSQHDDAQRSEYPRCHRDAHHCLRCVLSLRCYTNIRTTHRPKQKCTTN